jgi:hypothetical protein
MAGYAKHYHVRGRRETHGENVGAWPDSSNGLDLSRRARPGPGTGWQTPFLCQAMVVPAGAPFAVNGHNLTIVRFDEKSDRRELQTTSGGISSHIRLGLEKTDYLKSRSVQLAPVPSSSHLRRNCPRGNTSLHSSLWQLVDTTSGFIQAKGFARNRCDDRSAITPSDPSTVVIGFAA